MTKTCPACKGELHKTQPIGEIHCKSCGLRAALKTPQIVITLTTWTSFYKVRKSNNLAMV